MSETVLAPVARGPPPGADDTLALVVGNQTLIGWQRITVNRALAAVPASFDLQVTEKAPKAPDIDVEPGTSCEIRVGGDLVLTGYVDRYSASIASGEHTVRVTGRSKSCDLVDCSALVENTTAGGDVTPGMQILNGTTLSIVEKLAAPYKVPVKSLAGDGINIPQFNINLGETVWEIVDRVTRYSKMLAYDDPDGTLVLASLGTQVMSSGVATGSNIESADVSFAMDQRFSEYEGHLISTMALGTDAGINAPGVGEIVRDDGVPRFRKKYVISEQFVNGRPIAADRAIWECNRRKGQSQVLTATIDAWRDAAGKLWAPNLQIPIWAAPLKLANIVWLIASVSYIRDENGQHATLTLMDRLAFWPEPTAPGWLVTMDDINRFNPTKPDVPSHPAPGLSTPS